MKKFWKCCVTNCENDESLVQLDVKHPSIKRICFCFEHIIEGHELKKQLEAGKDTNVLGINVDNTQGTTVPTRTPKLIEKTIAPIETWEWISDFNRWMSLDGQVLKITQLDDKELEDATIAIQETNIKRITKRIQWIAQLKEITLKPQYLYPQEKMNVGLEEAYAKLEEFYEVMVERGLTPN